MKIDFETLIAKLQGIDQWRPVVGKALALISGSNILSEEGPSGPISSLRTARLYESRRDHGLTEESSPGLAETYCRWARKMSLRWAVSSKLIKDLLFTGMPLVSNHLMG